MTILSANATTCKLINRLMLKRGKSMIFKGRSMNKRRLRENLLNKRVSLIRLPQQLSLKRILTIPINKASKSKISHLLVEK